MARKVAVIFGGRSAEHDVSIITAHTPITQALVASGRFEVYPIYVAREGSWYSDPAMNSISYFADVGFEAKLAKLSKVRLLFDGGLKIIWPGLKQRQVAIDVVFPAMHGTYGEDGSLMGLLRMADVPFVGCDLSASAVAMDKALTKQVLAAEGVPVVPYVWFTAADWAANRAALEQRIAELELPLFVKPVHLGSSIGIGKVRDRGQLADAIEVALHYDDKVLVEEAVNNLVEVTLPIMGNADLRLGGIERPLNRAEFFDFSDKYLSGGKGGSGVNSQYSEIPAKITPELAAQVEELGRRTYRTLGCAGVARVDFLIEGAQGKVYVNEVNTLPGSLYHHNWRQVGVSSVELVCKLIELAEERFASQRRTTYTFSSEILSKVGGKTNG